MPCILIQFTAARSFDYAQDDGAGRAYARAFEEKTSHESTDQTPSVSGVCVWSVKEKFQA